MARIGVVSRFVAFLPILRRGVISFAAHCRDIVAVSDGDPGLGELLADRTVIVYATGAERTLALAPPGIPTIEYRHVPDPGDVDRLIRPLVDASAGPRVPQRKDAE
jgi:hypothetical protein